MTALNAPCSEAGERVCPAREGGTRSIPQPQASTARPDDQKRPNTALEHDAVTLGGPSATSGEPGGRSRCSTARRVTLLASGRVMTTRRSQKPGIA